MSEVDEREISEIIERVRRRVSASGDARPGEGLRAEAELAASMAAELGDGIHATIDEAVAAATLAFLAFQAQGLAGRKIIIDAVRRSMLEHAEQLARMAHQETHIGRVDDKVVKNRLVASKAPGPEDLEVEAVSGDNGMMVTEFAPFGVVAAITPVTNPTSTIINNTISIVSAGNAVVFNAHPSASRCSAETVRLINRAVVGAGGPPNLVSAAANPTIDSARALMSHPGVRVLLVTGGPAVVREALKTDKRAITAGPGNPPAVVDQTADIERAGRDIVLGASFDNNVVCIDEKVVFVVDIVADRLIRAMTQGGAYLLKEHELRRLERVVFKELGQPGKPGVMNPAWIGQDAKKMLAEIGVRGRARAKSPDRGRAARPQPGLDRTDDAAAADRAREHRGPGDRSGRPRRAWLPPYGLDPLHERGDDHEDGPRDELQHLRYERAQRRGPGRGRRGLHFILDRQPVR